MSTRDAAVAESPTGFWRGRSALIMPAILVGIAIFLIVGVLRMDVPDDAGLFGPTAFPIMTVAACLIVAVLLVISILRNPSLPEPPDPFPEPRNPTFPEPVEGQATSTAGPAQATVSNWRSIAIVVGTLILFVLLLETAGWIIAAGLLFAGVSTGLGGKRYGVNVLAGFALSALIQLIFVGGLGLSLPAGVWGWF
jgi:putative tricarboxylic transport membrane protein